jgi:hypothetical protein
MDAPVGQYLRKQMLEHEYKKICIDTDYMTVPGLLMQGERYNLKVQKKGERPQEVKGVNLGCWKEL